MKKRGSTRKLLLRCALGFLLIGIIGEIILRHFFGFCDAPLYVSSEKYEYIPAPNQEGKRFGNHYYYNSFSQRSDEPDQSRNIILGLGDSVIFGGVQTDQDSIATSIFTNEMENFQMLNISAGSWGPDNCAAYLGEHGTFGARGMFLVVSSHDAFDTMDFTPVVGIHESFPQHQYLLAWGELFGRYLMPRIKNYLPTTENTETDEAAKNGIRKGGLVFNPGFDKLKSIADSLHIPLTVYLHAETSEMSAKKYNDQGDKIIQWAGRNNVRIIKELEYNFDESDYRDYIHINNQGQRKLANIMLETINQGLVISR